MLASKSTALRMARCTSIFGTIRISRGLRCSPAMIRCRLVVGASPISTVPLLLPKMMPAAAYRLYYSGLPNPSVTRNQDAFRLYQPASSSRPLQLDQPQPLICSLRLLSVQSKEPRSRNRGVRLPLDGCKSIDDVLKLVLNNIDNLPLNQAAAAWSFIFRLLSKEQRNGRDLKRTRIDDAQRPEQREQQLQLFLQYTLSSLDKLKFKDLTTIVLSMAKIVKSIREAHERKRMSTYHQSLGRLLQQSNPFGHFAKAADAKLMTFDARSMSNLAYAYALVGYNPKFEDGSSLLQKIGDRSITCINQFDPQGLANTVWAFAKTDVHHAALFEAVEDHIVRLDDLTAFTPQAIANIVWAYATLNVQHAALFEAIGDHIVRLDDLSAFKPQALANISWAYATLYEKHPALFEEVGNHMVRLGDLAAFEPQALANISWAYATLNVQHAALFEEVGDHIVGLDDLSAFEPQALANISWAYATLNKKHQAVFEKVGQHIARMDNLAAFKPQELANISWAYATLNKKHQAMFEKFGNHIVRLDDLTAFRPQALANIVWAYATLNESHQAMFERVGHHIVRLDGLAIFNSQELANIVWAYAKVNAKHPALFKQIGNSIVGFGSSKQFIPQALANIVWAFVKVGEEHLDLFNMIGQSIAAVNDLAMFEAQALANISWAMPWQILMHLGYSMADLLTSLLRGSINSM